MSFSFVVFRQHLGAGFDWNTADVRMLLLDAAASWAPDENLGAIEALNPGTELATTGYARQAITGRRIDTFGAAPPRWFAEPVTFPALGPSSGGPTLGGAIIFEQLDSEGLPMFFLDDVVGQVSGTDAVISLGELVGIHNAGE